MSGNGPRKVSVWASAVLLAFGGTASAQFYSTPGSGVSLAPVTSASPRCECVVPVAQTQYQTVPVTEYRQVKQVVQRPVLETQYVDREVVEYHPQVETRTAEIPTVSYHNVTEYHTVQRDQGFWTTQYEHRPKVAPCQYDPRPGLAGWFNRTGYSIRSSFTPEFVAHRTYVPNVVAETVPVTRQVAQYGTRQVAYNVTTMVPHTTTRKVAVNTVRYVSEEIVATQPVTVMRTVPIGTSVAYAVAPFSSSSQVALQPTPDPLGTARAAGNTGNTGRTADSRNNLYENQGDFTRPTSPGPATRYNRDENTLPFDADADDQPVRPRGASLSVPAGAEKDAPTFRETRRPEPAARPTVSQDTERQALPVRPAAVPSIVRLNRWTATVRSQAPAAETADAPVLTGPTITVAGSER